MAFLVWVLWDYMTGRKPSLIGSVNGMIVGLVAITPAAGFVNGYGAMLIGVIASSIVYLAYNYLSRCRPFRNVDDTLGVVYTHGFAGVVGGLLVGVLADSNMAVYINPDGTPWFSGTGSLHLLRVQVYGRAVGDLLHRDRHVHHPQARRARDPAADERQGARGGRHRDPRARGVPVGHPVARLHRRRDRPGRPHPPHRSRPSADRRRGPGDRARRAPGPSDSREDEMATKIIVSYDGSDNDRDALALGRKLANAGASLALAYVRHMHETGGREQLAEHEADALLAGGAAWLGNPDVPRFVVLSASTPEGLKELAAKEEASAIVFGSAYRTTPGHVDPQASAQRFMEGGSLAVAVAPAGYHDFADAPITTIAAVDEEGDTSAAQTAATLASKLGATVADRASQDVSLLIVGSKAVAVHGTVMISAASAYLIELTPCPTIVLPRGVPLAL